MSLEQDAERGRQAQEVLANPVYADSYALIETEIFKRWQESNDEAERNELHRVYRLIAKSKKIMEQTMRSGQIAAEALQQKRSLAERVGLKYRPS